MLQPARDAAQAEACGSVRRVRLGARVDAVLADLSLLPDASAYTGTDGLTPGVDVTRLPNVARVRAGR